MQCVLHETVQDISSDLDRIPHIFSAKVLRTAERTHTHISSHSILVTFAFLALKHAGLLPFDFHVPLPSINCCYHSVD